MHAQERRRPCVAVLRARCACTNPRACAAGTRCKTCDFDRTAGAGDSSKAPVQRTASKDKSQLESVSAGGRGQRSAADRGSALDSEASRTDPDPSVSTSTRKRRTKKEKRKQRISELVDEVRRAPVPPLPVPTQGWPARYAGEPGAGRARVRVGGQRRRGPRASVRLRTRARPPRPRTPLPRPIAMACAAATSSPCTCAPRAALMSAAATESARATKTGTRSAAQSPRRAGPPPRATRRTATAQSRAAPPRYARARGTTCTPAGSRAARTRAQAPATLAVPRAGGAKQAPVKRATTEYNASGRAVPKRPPSESSVSNPPPPPPSTSTGASASGARDRDEHRPVAKEKPSSQPSRPAAPRADRESSMVSGVVPVPSMLPSISHSVQSRVVRAVGGRAGAG